MASSDSTGVLELIEFLEERCQIEVAETETVPENLGSRQRCPDRPAIAWSQHDPV